MYLNTHSTVMLISEIMVAHAHELQCLLCKLPMVCSKGKMVDLQDHLRKDHEVVR